MRTPLLLPDLVVPLLQGVVVRAQGEEVVAELGSIPVRTGRDPAVVVVVDFAPLDGRGTWQPGLWWPDEEEPRWADQERPWRVDRVALPIHPDDDGVERQVRVMVRVRPLGPMKVASATFDALARFPA